MKILFFCSKFPPLAGGAGIDAFQLGRDLSTENNQVFVVCERLNGLRKYEQINHNFFVYRIKAPLIKASGSGLYFITLCIGIGIKGLILILRHKINILHCHDAATGIAGLITKTLTNIPTIFKFGGSMTYEYLCNANKKNWDPIWGEGWAWKNATGFTKLLLIVEKQFYFKFDRIYPIAKYMLQLLNHNLKLNENKIKLIHNGVETDLIRKEKYEDIKNELNINRLIFTGVRLVKCKGVHVLIDACNTILEEFNAHLVISGSGPEEKLLRKMAKDNPRIIFNGNLAWEINIRFVRSADIFILSSFVDKTPSCLMEALSLEIPCIASDIEGIRELITPGGGFLVPPNNPSAIRDKIKWIFQNPKKAKKMGINGRQYVEQNFRWEQTKENIKLLYHSLLDKHY